MGLAAGDSLGPYTIVSALGAGGMGEVYRARDSKLHREVAVKVLPPSLAADPDRIARFEREARVLASLNHPNIAQIYGIEDSTPVRALVLELVEGPTLADRIAQGPLPIDEALAIVRQIADALEAAHDLGVVHRDLKPANVKLRPDGTVKVLDFGLAKALAPLSDMTTEIRSSSPGVTGIGAILGTAAYMSPEQARGEGVDKRTDIWALGVVLFEMLTGGPLFARPTVTDTIAAVVHIDPEWNRVPARVRPLLRACLSKDSKRRLRDVADARLLLDQEDAGRDAGRQTTRAWIPRTAVAALAIVAGGAIVAWAPWRTPTPAAEVVRFPIVPPGDIPTSAASAISPDGRYLAFMSTGSDGVMRVWVRDLRSLESRPLLGTEIAQSAPPPFWRPDSRFIAYDAGGALKKIDVSGGLPQKICDLPYTALGGSWNRDGVILFGSLTDGIRQVSDTGGEVSAVTAADLPGGARALTPVFLPDGRHFFYLRASGIDPGQSGIFLGSLDTKPEAQDGRRLVATTTSAAYAPAGSATGRLLFLRDGNLMSQVFDERRLELVGTPVLVSGRVHSYRDTATVSASENGVLVYKGATEASQLTWFDRQSGESRREGEPGLHGGLALSPDGTRAIVARINPQATASSALWLFDVASHSTTRLTVPQPGSTAIWSADGSRITFTSNRVGFETVLMEKPVSGQGQEQELFRSNLNRVAPTSWSRDGKLLLYVVVDPKTNSDLWVLSRDGMTRTPFLRSNAAESQAQFSPDTRSAAQWVAYTSNESGRDEVQLRTFPDTGNPVTISRTGGHSPRWRGDGRELFYLAADGTVMAVAISDDPQRPGAADALFRTPPGFARPDASGRRTPAAWDVMPDGQRFLLAAPVEGGGSSAFTVVLNWQTELSK